MSKIVLKGLPPEKNFLGIDEKFSSFWDSKAVIWPVAYERTTTYLKGTVNGPKAILEASPSLEFYDEIRKYEPYRVGITTLPIMTEFAASEEDALKEISEGARQILTEGKFLVTLGGEHSITPALVREFKTLHPNLSVLHLDAHADLRDSYEGSRNNHACAMARTHEICPHVSMGIRAYSVEEAALIEKEKLNIIHAYEMHGLINWQRKILESLSDTVYISLDFDYFDPGIMPAVGTPEPGGGDWYGTLNFLEKVFATKNVVGIDLVELRPIPNFEVPAFTAARMAYHLISMKFWERG